MDRPILFSAPMVRALLARTKTQTRRLYSGPIEHVEELPSETIEDMEIRGFSSFEDADGNWFMAKPRINWRDLIYVREHWRCEARFDHVSPRDLPAGIPIYYVADPDPRDSEPGCAGRFRQGMHMPRWASRLTLTVTDVRIQRLQEIRDTDAIAEGIELVRTTEQWGRQWRNYGAEGFDDRSARYSYCTFWNSINGPGSWDANPWVAAHTFTVESRNIDSGRG